jgi:stage II sporulation protein D
VRRAARAPRIVAFLLVAGTFVACRTAAPPAPELPEPIPAPEPTGTPVPPEPPTPTPVPAAVLPEREIRVLIQSPGDPSFPEPGRRFLCAADGQTTLRLRGPLRLRVVGQRPALQVGAFGQPENAQAAAARLREAGIETEQRPGDGLVRVVAVGRAGETEEALAARVRTAGFAEASRAAPASGGAVVVEGEDGATIEGRELRLTAADPEPVRVGPKALRGSFLVRPGGDGVRLINVLPLEQYLRGVVPAEMGPRVFPALEALKAQAVAARTYAIAHLGDHDEEGWDLCDTPACQVYGGVEVEQPATDEAVAATAGEVAVFAGMPIDAMYHSTCAGHTEDAAALFPERAAPYLKGVPCRGDQEVLLGRGAQASAWFGSEERLAAVADALAARLRVKPDARTLAAKLGGGHAGHGPAGLAQAFSLAEAGTLLHDSPGPLTDARVLEVLRLFRLPVPPAPGEGDRDRWELAVVVRLGQLAGAAGTVTGRAVPGPLGPRMVADGDELEAYDLTSDVVVLARDGERWRRGEVRAATGSPVTAWLAEGRPVLAEVEPLASADARSAWNWWVREFPAEEVARRLGVPQATTVEVSRRGISGRVLTLKVGGGGRNRELSGYAVRRALDLPDTLFVVLENRNGSDRSWRFLGRGWGHGVGMCQNGAYGLALAGLTYREILATYYSGVEVQQLAGEPAGGGR